MDQATLDGAIALARATVGATTDVPVEALPVRRLDRDTYYVLVRLGRPGWPGWVVAVDPPAREAMTWAANPSGHPTAPQPVGGELVWWAGGPSRSPLYPLLRRETPDGEVFADLTGVVRSDRPHTHG